MLKYVEQILGNIQNYVFLFSFIPLDSRFPVINDADNCRFKNVIMIYSSKTEHIGLSNKSQTP